VPQSPTWFSLKIKNNTPKNIIMAYNVVVIEYDVDSEGAINYFMVSD
jgi:hypothetical protein